MFRMFFKVAITMVSLLLPLKAETINAHIIPDSMLGVVPDAPTFYLNHQGEALVCTPVALIKKKNRKDLIEYHCAQTKKEVANPKDRKNPDFKVGQDESQQLHVDAKEKVDEGMIYRVEIPQSDLKHIALARFSATRKLNNTSYTGVVKTLMPAKLYLSFRPEFANNGEDGGLAFRKGGSRGGFYYYLDVGDRVEFAMQYEANIKSGESFVNSSDDENTTRRLSYLSMTYEDYKILIGKYWSAYYDIAGQTDTYMAFGAQASGAYPNDSDGGDSGTGRADGMIQLRVKKESFNLSVQMQADHSAQFVESDIDYAYGVAGSIVYKGYPDIQIGSAIVYGKFDTITSQMHAMGIDGDDLSSILGFSYDFGKYGTSANLSYTRNHMNDDEGIYFDGIGAELSLQYDFSDSVRLAGGGNWLFPRDDHYEGDYCIKNTIVSLQYTFGKKTFDDLVYLEVSIPHGRLANGDMLDKSVAVGIRYLFSR